MTEAEWLECKDPPKMEAFLKGVVSERKWRLLACACCRRLWHLLADERSRHGVEATEQFADGHITREQLRQAGSAAYQAWLETEPRTDDDEDHPRFDPHQGQALFCAANAVVRLTGTGEHTYNAPRSELLQALWFATFGDQRAARDHESKAQCDLVRDLIGNPFRPVTLAATWLTPAVKLLAQGIYDERAFDRLPILADALEEAGCTSADLLSHCRQPGKHVRGCWAVDLLLGKE